MAHCGYLITEDGRFLITEDGRRLVTECFTPEPPQEQGFGLARLFYFQEQDRRKRRQRQEEEILALMGIEL